MSSPVMSPQLPVWDESYFRDLMPASGDALVWPTRPAGRAGAATAAVLTVGALGGMAAIAQAIVAGSIPLPVALWPAPDAVAHPAVGSATGGEADLGHRKGAIPDSPHIAGPEIVRDSDVHEADGATGHHTWQPPRVPANSG